MEEPAVGFYNESNFVFSMKNPVPTEYVSWAVVFVVFFRQASQDHWTYFVSTYEQFVVMNGKYQGVGLQVFILAVTEEGIASRSLLDIDYLYNVSLIQNATGAFGLDSEEGVGTLDIIAISAMGCYVFVVVMVCVFLYCYHKRPFSGGNNNQDNNTTVHFRRYNTDIDSQIACSQPSNSTPMAPNFHTESKFQPEVSDVESVESSPLSESYYTTGIQLDFDHKARYTACPSAASLEPLPPVPHNTLASVHTYEQVNSEVTSDSSSSSLTDDGYIYMGQPWAKYHTLTYLDRHMCTDLAVDSTWDHNNTSVVI